MNLPEVKLTYMLLVNCFKTNKLVINDTTKNGTCFFFSQAR